MSKKIQTQPDDKEQSRQFAKAARDLDCSEERFQEALRTVAKAKPQSQPKKKDRPLEG